MVDDTLWETGRVYGQMGTGTGYGHGHGYGQWLSESATGFKVSSSRSARFMVADSLLMTMLSESNPD